MAVTSVWMCFICDDTPHFDSEAAFLAHMQAHEQKEKRACDTLH